MPTGMIDLAEADYLPVLKQPGPIFLSGTGSVLMCTTIRPPRA